MVKIFQLITSVNLGGAENIAFSLAEKCEMTNPGEFEFIIVELYSTKSEYSLEKKNDLFSKKIKTISLFIGSKRMSLFFSSFSLIYAIFRKKPHIIHSHTDLPDLVLSTTLRILPFFRIKKPIIIRTIHNTELWATHNKLGKYTENGFVDDIVIGVSEASLMAYNNLRNRNELPRSPFQQVIHNGCSFPQLKDTPFHINNEKYNIAFCGRFESQKGIDILIERIREINNKFSDNFIFHLIGSGSYRNEVLKLSKEFSNVVLYDAVSNISDKLHVFDFLIMPSRFEGLVLMSIEASFARVPVIAAFAPGLDETLPRDWPLKFQLESATALIAIFEKIVNKEFDLLNLQTLAFKYVTEKFSANQMVDSYSKLYLSTKH
jgi:glycosyltransferase involved in cell wall biosynthesis